MPRGTTNKGTTTQVLLIFFAQRLTLDSGGANACRRTYPKPRHRVCVSVCCRNGGLTDHGFARWRTTALPCLLLAMALGLAARRVIRLAPVVMDDA